MNSYKFADDLYNLIAALHRNNVISHRDALRYNDDIFNLANRAEINTGKEIYHDRNIYIYARHRSNNSMEGNI